MNKVRMRYPAEAVRELKKEDPDTRVTVHFIRSLMKRGVIPYIRVGRGYLFNYDKLLEYLSDPQMFEESENYTGIRPVVE